MEDRMTEFINPRKFKWTIYGSFIQLAVVFLGLLFDTIGVYKLPVDSKFLILYGLGMTLLSVRNTKTKYEKLDIALSIQPLYCPHCGHKNVAMLPIEYKCPECHATSKKET